MLINASSADWWATGVVFYELLTGALPFITCHGSASAHGSASMDASASTGGSTSTNDSVSMHDLVLLEVPDSVPPESRVQWAKYQAMLDAQQSWVSSSILLSCKV